MKTSTLQAHDMLPVLIVDDVEKRIGDVPGVVIPRLAAVMDHHLYPVQT